MALTPKNLLLNWEQPKITYRGKSSSSPEEFLLIKKIIPEIHGTKWPSILIDFKKSNLDFFYKDIEPKKLAVSFGEDGRLIFVFNPDKDVPFYKLSKNGAGLAVNNRDLLEKIYKYFKLNDKTPKYYLKGRSIEKIGNMEFFHMTPHIYETMLPVFEDELLGK